jgi:hypothetical protein
MRDWWLRTLLVLQRPTPVFVALRDDSKQSVADRSEPILAIVILAGMAGALDSSTAAHLMDYNVADPGATYDGIDMAVWVFIAGSISGVFGYFALGGLLHLCCKLLGSQGSFRRNRQIVAFAAVPVALSLVLWPVKLALYGWDVFKTGGADAGAGSHVFAALELGLVAWSAALLVVGVRAVHGWTWPRAAVAAAAAVAVPVVVSFL